MNPLETFAPVWGRSIIARATVLPCASCFGCEFVACVLHVVFSTNFEGYLFLRCGVLAED
jgi:hypothetical protein